jgi:hypothetical protein
MDALTSCTYFGTCYASSAELLKASVVQEAGEAGWQRTQALAARFVTDIKSGNTAALLKR